MSYEEVDFSLRIFTSHAKEIKFTPFFLSKLSEKHGLKIVSILFEKSFTIYCDLMSKILDFCYRIDAIQLNNLGKNLKSAVLDLCEEGGNYEILLDYKMAKEKYQAASFIIEELIREMSHSLNFSSFTEDHQCTNINMPVSSSDDNVRQVSDKASKTIKGFTFDKQHTKIRFTPEDEQTILQVQRMIQKRMQVIDKYVVLTQ